MPVVHCPRPACAQPFQLADATLIGPLRCPSCGEEIVPATVPASTLTLPPTSGQAPATTPIDPHATIDPQDTAPLSPSQPADPYATAAPTGAMPAIRIGRFDIRAQLGEGAFGVVYRAYDAQLDREVALKVAKAHMLSTEELVKRFLREAKAAAHLRHPNIVPVHDSGKDGEQFFIASAFIAGRSLAGLLAEQPGRKGLEPRRAAAILQRLAEALAYAHSKGIIHRDIKPANAIRS